jgi:hypothetical protein
MKTITGVFSSMPDLERALRQVESAGVSSAAISVIGGNEADKHHEFLEKAKHASRTPAAAATSGASLGGGAGILASLVALAIPGVGPILAGGAIVNILAGLGIGAATGSMISVFHNMAISHEEAPLYEEAARRGLLMLVVQVDEPMETEVVEIMREYGARTLYDEADTWRAHGWQGPKSDPHPYVGDTTIRSHEPPAS